MTQPRTKKQRQGDDSRELILDTTERLMGTRGYAATSISDICKACGLPASSIYWHFGSKDGVLAAVMERGAARFFAAIPQRGGSASITDRLDTTARLIAQHPDFLRLFLLLSLERNAEPAVAALIQKVRDTAISGWRDAIAELVPASTAPAKAERVVNELTALAVAISDGVFIADHLEPDTTDVERMYRRLFQALSALLPIMLEEE